MKEVIHKKEKKSLSLTPISEKEGVLVGTKKNGVSYSVRSDRKRYFFPDEWTKFFNTLTKEEHKIFFLTSLHCGGRIMEILNLRACNFDYERQTITLDVVKQRKAKKNFYATGKSRTFFVSNALLKKVKAFIKKNEIKSNEYLFLNNDQLPGDYAQLNNEDKKKYYQKKIVSYSQLLKRKVKASGIKDYWAFSPHNLRKTYGMWMRIYDIRMEEICYRLGHDLDTYLAHYGSPLIFTPEEKRKIMRIMGEVK